MQMPSYYHYVVKFQCETQDLSLWLSDEGVPKSEHYSVVYGSLNVLILIQLGRKTHW